MERGLTVEQIASSQRTSLDNARSYVRGTEAMLRGELPTAPSMALKASGGYRYLLGCDVSPALRSYVTSCLGQLKAINPKVRVEEGAGRLLTMRPHQLGIRPVPGGHHRRPVRDEQTRNRGLG